MVGVRINRKLGKGASGDVLVSVDGLDAVLSLITANGGHRELYELRRLKGVAGGASSWWHKNALVMRYDEMPEDFYKDNGWEPTYFKPMVSTRKNDGIGDEEFAAKYGPWVEWMLGYSYWDEAVKFVREFRKVSE